VTGSRTWEWALVAKAPGSHTIPALTYAYFDPARKEYRTASSAPLTIEVAKGAGEPEPIANAPGNAPAGGRRAVEPVRRDIAYIKTTLGRSGPAPRPVYARPVFVALLALPVALNLGVLLYGWGRRRESAHGPLVRRRGARGAALARLKQVEQALRRGQAPDVPSAVSEALTGFVADWFDAPRAGLTRARIEELLREAAVPAAASAELARVLGRADELGFSPGEGRKAAAAALLAEARASVVGLEKALKRKRKRA
jgi:hypothetical protein